MSHRTDGPDYVAVAAMNISSDPWKEVCFRTTLDKPPSEVAILGESGTRNVLEDSDWTFKKDLLEVRHKMSIPPHNSVIARIWR